MIERLTDTAAYLDGLAAENRKVGDDIRAELLAAAAEGVRRAVAEAKATRIPVVGEVRDGVVHAMEGR